MMNRIIDIWHNTRDLVGLLTAERAGNLDRLDAKISSRLSDDSAKEYINTLLEDIIKSKNTWNKKLLTTPGTFSFVIPDDVYLVFASLSGAGGGAGYYSAGSGSGGGGAGIIDLPMSVSPGQSLTGVIGSGGTGDTNGGKGGETSLLTLKAEGGFGCGRNSPANGGRQPDAPAAFSSAGFQGSAILTTAPLIGGLGGASASLDGAGKGGDVVGTTPYKGENGAVMIRWFGVPA